jgi:hypothetical protein
LAFLWYCARSYHQISVLKSGGSCDFGAAADGSTAILEKIEDGSGSEDDHHHDRNYSRLAITSGRRLGFAG